MTTVPILVVGSRTFDDYDMLKKTLDRLLNSVENIEIVSGGARGADSLAERYAKEKGFSLKVFYANWNKYGKSAGYRRNAEMHQYISMYPERICVAFWDGKSKGTAHNFELAKRYNTNIEIIKYNAEIVE